MANQKHLILEERQVIQECLDHHVSFKEIGRKLNKDCSTISKEVRARRVTERKGGIGRVFNDCLHRRTCKMWNLCQTCTGKKKCSACGRCFTVCDQYEKENCPKLTKPPYVCNGCEARGRCTLEKKIYRSNKAQENYNELLTESRSGISMTEKEIQRLNQIISPLVKNGQSIHHICTNHSNSIMCSERTIYELINAGFLEARNIDLPRKVRFRPRKKGGKTFKVEKKCRIGRTMEDYQQYCMEHPELHTTELDSVEGVKGGAALLTIHFVKAKLQLAFWREANDAASVTEIFHQLLRTLGTWDYKKILSLLLADNGSEFSNPTAIEYTADGERVSRLFYCDPSAPGQKGHCENNHEFIRRIIPKGTDLGNYTQGQISLMMNHINSYGRPELNDRSPYEMFAFLYGEELLHKLGVIRIPRDKIILTPKLFTTTSSPVSFFYSSS